MLFIWKFYVTKTKILKLRSWGFLTFFIYMTFSISFQTGVWGEVYIYIAFVRILPPPPPGGGGSIHRAKL
jgi:hypothetical protein